MKVLIWLHLPLWISHRRLIITSQYRCCPPGTHDLGLSMCQLEKGRPGVKTVSSNRRRRRVHVRFMFPVKAGQGRVGSRSRLWSLSLSSVQFSHSVVSDSLWPHESQHARPPCPSPTPGVYSNSCPLSQWCRPAISSSVVPFSSCPQSLPASGSFPMSQLFAWGGQSAGVSASASVLPMNTQDWSPLGWTGWISNPFPQYNYF